MTRMEYSPVQIKGLSKQKDRFERNAVNPSLQQLFLEVTPRCNLSCAFCGSRCNEHAETEEVPLEAYGKLLKEVKENFGTKVFIVLTGGEPLLRKDLFELAAMIRDEGFLWGMTSNATLIGREEAEKLVETGIYSIAVSVDGLPAVHDRLRGKNGAFGKAIAGLECLKAASGDENRIADIMATTVFTRQTIGKIRDVWNLVRELPVDTWRPISVEPVGSARDNPDMLLTPDDFRTLLSFIREKREEHWPVTYGCSHFLGPRFEGEVRDWYYLCSAGIHVASVMHNGDIGSCLDIERRPETVFGNIYRDSFADVWRNGFGIYRRGLWKLNAECSACPDCGFCRGDSAHSWDYDENRPLVCMREIENVHPDGKEGNV